ncbi:hypothetical protein BRADI_4g22585v3 [Brachypodium distachyon]|uniref:Uncharacterized protein n=1 Tax=Brachypodium distachyon TaxID=15368 RepID=A0A0Q3ENB2_BRADI|nr:hypothetical protein BRADI_4g22585v3 [Brachypodium distachyon]PNT63948.1 hypothetical protein BRADI_4g22585v3 [Brachypodium distachyon]
MLATDHSAGTESKLDVLAHLEPEEEDEAARLRARAVQPDGRVVDLLHDALDNLQAKIYGNGKATRARELVLSRGAVTASQQATYFCISNFLILLPSVWLVSLECILILLSSTSRVARHLFDEMTGASCVRKLDQLLQFRSVECVCVIRCL